MRAWRFRFCHIVPALAHHERVNRCGVLLTLAVAGHAAGQTLVFSDDFDGGGSVANWSVFHTGDASTNFAFNYASVGVPSAPNSAGGSTIGLRFSVNDSAGAPHAVSAYPTGLSVAGDHALRFDLWLNYNGGSGGGPGSTQFSTAGVLHTGAGVVWANNPASDGCWFAVSGEGGDANDYRAYEDATQFTPAAGVYIAGNQNSTHTYYQTIFNSPPYETRGAPGKRWVQAEVRRLDGRLEWRLNGNLIATRAEEGTSAGDVMLGYMDTFASIANPPADNFVLYDNVRVETYPPPDCNTNGVSDAAELAAASSLDCNDTDRPDECEALGGGDFDGNGLVHWDDAAALADCIGGPGAAPTPLDPACVGACLAAFDSAGDLDIDLADFAGMQAVAMTSLIPPRPRDALRGSAVVPQISPLSLAARDQRILQEILAGNVPDFLRTFQTVEVSATIGGSLRTATYEVAADYLAIGSNADFVRMPMMPDTAQAIADAFGCLLPTRKMVNDIWADAPIRLAPSPISPAVTDITQVSTFWQHNVTIESQRAGYALGPLVGGIKKDVVITVQLASNPGRVAIYGWHQLNGQPIQPLYLGHGETHVDYSHGIRLVKGVMQVDGVKMPVAQVLADPNLNVLLSDEGPVTNPRY